jgi:replicative DNA helicase
VTAEMSEARTPPQDLAAEQSVLGGMLLSNGAIADVIEAMQGRDFYRPAHEILYEVILDLYGRGEPADAVTVSAELTRRGNLVEIGGPAYLHTLISSVPTAANAGYYARIVHERAVLRRLVTAGTRIVQLGYAEEGGGVDAVVAAAQAEVFGVIAETTTTDYRAAMDLLEETFDAITAASQISGLTGVPTGFADLDRLTNGLQAGQMIIVAARPATGKSTLAVNIARACALRHLTAAVFSLEMGRTEIMMRLLSDIANVHLQAIRKGALDDRQRQRLAGARALLAQASLFIDDSPNMTMPQILAKCRHLKQSDDLRLVVVDYLQLMSSGRRVENRQQEVSEFSRALKLLAKELEVPVIAVSQLNRGPEGRVDKRPVMADLRESGSLEQDADLVILLHREDMYDKESPRAGEADFIVAKHRNGPTDTIPVAFQGHYSRFADMDDGEAA